MRDIAAHDRNAARHAGHLAGKRSAQALARIAVDLDKAAGHPRGRIGARSAADVQPAAAHQPPRLLPDLALDDDLARAHAGAHEIKALQTALEAQRSGIPHADGEDISDLEPRACGVDGQPGDRAFAEALQSVGHEARQVDPLVRRRLEPEREGAHGSSDLR